MADDRMLQVLEAIRDEVRATNVRLETLDGHVQNTNAQLVSLDGRVQDSNVRLGAVEERLQRIEQHSADLGDRFARMTRRQTESELRLSTEVAALADATKQVRDLLATRLDDHRWIVDHERRLVEVEKRGP
jgi:chromosome segregation ATPase